MHKSTYHKDKQQLQPFKSAAADQPSFTTTQEQPPNNYNIIIPMSTESKQQLTNKRHKRPRKVIPQATGDHMNFQQPREDVAENGYHGSLKRMQTTGANERRFADNSSALIQITAMDSPQIHEPVAPPNTNEGKQESVPSVFKKQLTMQPQHKRKFDNSNSNTPPQEKKSGGYKQRQYSSFMLSEQDCKGRLSIPSEGHTLKNSFEAKKPHNLSLGKKSQMNKKWRKEKKRSIQNEPTTPYLRIQSETIDHLLVLASLKKQKNPSKRCSSIAQQQDMVNQEVAHHISHSSQQSPKTSRKRHNQQKSVSSYLLANQTMINALRDPTDELSSGVNCGHNLGINGTNEDQPAKSEDRNARLEERKGPKSQNSCSLSSPKVSVKQFRQSAMRQNDSQSRNFSMRLIEDDFGNTPNMTSLMDMQQQAGAAIQLSESSSSNTSSSSESLESQNEIDQEDEDITKDASCFRPNNDSTILISSNLNSKRPPRLKHHSHQNLSRSSKNSAARPDSARNQRDYDHIKHMTISAVDNKLDAHSIKKFLTKSHHQVHREGLQNDLWLEMESGKDSKDQEAKDGVNQCIIMPSQAWKMRWDFYIMIMMVLAALLTPWQLAFVEKDTVEWIIVNAIIDISFLIDIVVTFNTAFFDEIKLLMVTDKCTIAKQYIRFWFWLDLLSIIPFDLIISHTSNGDMGNVAKISRVSKLYKMVRMLRMIKMIRIFKDRKKIMANLDKAMNTNAGSERILFYLFGFVLFNHTFSSIWIMLASFDERNNWRSAFRDKFLDADGNSPVDTYGDGDWYIVALYFIATTVTTVGYGDLGPMNNIERGFCNVLMFIGVVTFSFATGALGSMIASSNNEKAKLQEKLDLLSKIRKQFKLSEKLFSELQMAIKYEYSKNIDGLGDFMDRLPHKLKMAMALEIHKDLAQTFNFFDRQPEQQFLSWVGHRLTPRIIQEEQYIYQETDSISEIFFCLHGKIAYVLPRYDNAAYYFAVKGDIFGLEDAIYNVQLLGDEIDLKVMAKRKFYGDRRFTTMSLNMCEALTLNVGDLQKITSEFPRTIEFFYTEQSELLEKVVVARLRCMNQVKEAQEKAQDQGIPNQAARRSETQSVHVQEMSSETPAFRQSNMHHGRDTGNFGGLVLANQDITSSLQKSQKSSFETDSSASACTDQENENNIGLGNKSGDIDFAPKLIFQKSAHSKKSSRDLRDQADEEHKMNKPKLIQINEIQQSFSSYEFKTSPTNSNNDSPNQKKKEQKNRQKSQEFASSPTSMNQVQQHSNFENTVKPSQNEQKSQKLQQNQLSLPNQYQRQLSKATSKGVDQQLADIEERLGSEASSSQVRDEFLPKIRIIKHHESPNTILDQDSLSQDSDLQNERAQKQSPDVQILKIDAQLEAGLAQLHRVGNLIKTETKKNQGLLDEKFLASPFDMNKIPQGRRRRTSYRKRSMPSLNVEDVQQNPVRNMERRRTVILPANLSTKLKLGLSDELVTAKSFTKNMNNKSEQSEFEETQQLKQTLDDDELQRNQDMAIIKSFTMKFNPLGKSNKHHSPITPKAKGNVKEGFFHQNSSKTGGGPGKAESTTEILSDMHVLNSLKQGGNMLVSKAGTSLIEAGTVNTVMDLQSQYSDNRDKSRNNMGTGLQQVRDEDRLMELMDKKFSKFEDLIKQIANNMGELRGEVNTMKGKLADAKLL